MGCDFSILAKEEFTEKTVAIAKMANRINKKKDRVENLIRSYKGMNSADLECGKIRNHLCEQLVKLEEVLEEVKRIKEKSPSISLSISSSFEEAPRPPLAADAKEKFKLAKPVGTPVKISSSKQVNLNTTESILEDPEIMALISKNRERLLKKLTK